MTMDFRAILLFSLCALVTRLSGSPVVKSLEKQDPAELQPASNSVVTYKYDMEDGGKEFSERITIDMDKQTEYVHVDAHGNEQEADIISDFKQNLTMYRIPALKICLLGPLDDNDKSPSDAIEELEKGSKNADGHEKSSIVSNWSKGDVLEDRFPISDEMASLCAKYPIFKMEKSFGARKRRDSDSEWCLCGIYMVCYKIGEYKLCRLVKVCAC